MPELAAIPDKFLQEPWLADNAGAVLGKAYPMRIVDHAAAAKEAKDRIWAVRRGDDFRAEALAVAAKHGSRKSGIPHRAQRSKRKNTVQLTLPLGDPS